ncbi:MAG TPA: UbiH/UbiF/VisC/COQ6 family ubiquinone biosynthesis hydroxylase [Caulobacteraceae bacterium]|nr:UbiH/UbiF/VisC/COQ6 family ubiquinone biosynthesis hydroxylase [Caulobacteraceae bacterium]
MARAITCDVLIAGAGMAGATLALALKSGGLKPILVDPMPFDTQTAPTFDGRASAVAFSCFRQWRALGVGKRLEPHAQRIEQILVTDGRSPGAAPGLKLPAFLRFDSAEIADRSDGEPLGYLIENRHIRAALAQQVTAEKIKVLAPARVAGLDIGSEGARVHLQDGRTVQAPLVVGSDGRGSVVRREAKIGTGGWPYPEVGVVATVKLSRPHNGVAHEHFLPSGPFAILPLTEDRASLVWTEKAARGRALAAARPEVFHAHLNRRFGDFVGPASLDGPVFVYPLALELAETMTAPRIALLGDAAHGVHPIAGQGLNLGLKDAAALAEVLVEASRLGEDLGSEVALERYARWRRADNVALAAATDLFNRLFTNDIAPLRLMRGAGMALVNRIGPARRFFMQEAGGATGDLPRLLRGEAL